MELKTKLVAYKIPNKFQSKPLQLKDHNFVKKSLTVLIYKYLFVAFTACYWVFVIIDDWNFIEKYWAENWMMYLGIWMGYYIAILLMFSFYYWFIVGVSFLIKKLIQKFKS